MKLSYLLHSGSAKKQPFWIWQQLWSVNKVILYVQPFFFAKKGKNKETLNIVNLKYTGQPKELIKENLIINPYVLRPREKVKVKNHYS